MFQRALETYDKFTAAQLQIDLPRGGGSGLIRAVCGHAGHCGIEYVQRHGREPGLHRLSNLATRQSTRRSVRSASLPDPAVDHVGVQAMGQSNATHARSGLVALGQHLSLEICSIVSTILQSWGRCPLLSSHSRWVHRTDTDPWHCRLNSCPAEAGGAAISIRTRTGYIQPCGGAV